MPLSLVSAGIQEAGILQYCAAVGVHKRRLMHAVCLWLEFFETK